MADLYDLGFDGILDYLAELGERLDINTNERMHWARELTYDATPLPRVLVITVIADSPRSSSETKSGKSPRIPSGSTIWRVGPCTPCPTVTSSNTGPLAPGVCTS
jgi:hypothetical protein